MSTISITSGPNKGSRHAICEELASDGWVELGRGMSATVFSHPDCPDTVLKVGPSSDEWLEYAKTLIKCRSRHAPVIHAIEINDGHYFAEIERLQPISRAEWTDLGLMVMPMIHMIRDLSLRAFVKRTERIRKLFKLDWCYPDYHSGNFMRRPSTGDVVLTDPWS